MIYVLEVNCSVDKDVFGIKVGKVIYVLEVDGTALYEDEYGIKVIYVLKVDGTALDKDERCINVGTSDVYIASWCNYIL